MPGTFLRNCWYVAAEAGEVTRAPMPRLLLGQPVVMYRKENGTPVALEDRCCHRRAPLSKGKVVGDRLQCGYHGYTFDDSGACVLVPGQESVPPRFGVGAYPIVERHNFLWIWMGEQAKADPALIPDFSRSADRNWATVHQRLPIAANYLLVCENLIDLSHVGFVHAKTIGTDDTGATLTFERGENFVKVVREPVEVDTAPHNAKQGMGPRSVLEKTITFMPPCHIIIDVRTTEVSRKNDPMSLGITVLNACTPETDNSTHYFWASARDYQQEDKQVDAFMHKLTVAAFDEDKEMLEAQQRCIGTNPAAPYVSVNADQGSVQMRRLVAQRMADEAGEIATAAQ